MYLFFPAWLLGISQVHGCLEFVDGVGAAVEGGISQQECAVKCAEDRVCEEWTYNMNAGYCFFKPNVDKREKAWNFKPNLDVNLWVSGAKSCIGNIPYCINIVTRHDCDFAYS